MTLGKYQRKLEVMASTDKLTGAANRQAFEEHFAKVLTQSVLDGSPISILLMDIDHFKKVNDSHGHNVGDLVIQTLSHLLKGQLGEEELLCRWGGEEFLILLPKCSLSQGGELAERIRGLVAERELSVNGSQINVTISCGVAEYRHAEKAEELINRVDIALYQAKEQGRNRVVLSY